MTRFIEQSPRQFFLRVFSANQERGWWDTPRNLTQSCALIVTEMAEGIEGMRKDLQDDHLPQYPMRTVELADAIIRMADLFGGLMFFGYTPFIEAAFSERESVYVQFDIPAVDFLQKIRDDMPVASYCLASMFITRSVADVGIRFADRSLGIATDTCGFRRNTETLRAAYRMTMAFLVREAGSPEAASEIIEAKLAYNAVRADHSRENRSTVNGKKF